MKPMKVDSAPNTDKYPCDGEGNRMAGFGSTPEQPIFVPAISPLAPKQDIFHEAISPMASDRPFPIDVMAESHVCKSCDRTRKEQDLSLRLREMGDIELDILLSTQARLLMGQGQYGKFTEIDPRDLPKEALEEVQDALVYVAKRLGELSK